MQGAGVQNEVRVPVPTAAKRTVLLVEDEELVRELLCEVLRRAGYEVLACSHPREGLEVSRAYEGHIDVLLTDIVMPGMNGRQMADEIRSRLPELRVIFMSGYTEQALVQEGSLRPQIDYLQKPFSLQTLTQRLQRVLGEQPESVH